VPTDAGIKPRTIATGALTVRRSNHEARSHPQWYIANPLLTFFYALVTVLCTFLYFAFLIFTVMFMTANILKQILLTVKVDLSQIMYHSCGHCFGSGSALMPVKRAKITQEKWKKEQNFQVF
jgi:hypothetical protein